ncbi:uncharacterized protein si:dkey-9i23.16 [Osmerus eperlanus]|uniref:uncharacterized protein si:dkey-9i23.16 n=1 Tax=Osmerus eperlanus TaxID=29151 RepID=UPI002E0DC7F3
MASGEPAGPRLQRLFLHFDPEAAGVVTILLGLFQVLLSVPLYHMPISLPKHSFLVPLFIGFVIVAAGAFVVANEKSPNRQLLKGCAYSNIAGLLGAMLAFCVYVVSIVSLEPEPERCENVHNQPWNRTQCPSDYLETFFTAVNVLLLFYNIGALVLHSLLSVSSYKALKGY